MSQRKTQEVRSLTGIRGVAAFLVVIFHYHMLTSTAFFQHGYIWVDLFFILSGFVMMLTYGSKFKTAALPRTYADFLLKRIARVYPLYLVTSVVAFFVLYRYAPEQIRGFNIETVITNLLMIQSWGFGPSINGPAWSISTEFGAYLLFPWLIWAFSKGAFRNAAGCTIAFIFIAFVSTRSTLQLHQIDNGIPNRAGAMDIFGMGTLYPLLRCIGGFTLGLCVQCIAQLPRARRIFRSAMTANFVSIALLVCLCLHKADLGIIVCFALLVPFLASENNLAATFCGSTIVHWLGEISYSLYLVHRLLEQTQYRSLLALLKSHHVPAAAAVANVFLVCCSLALAALTYRFIEKPGRDWMRNLLQNKSAQQSIEAEPSAP
jgi:peptidoglycan/LPS O-acetylase OafA/YrhL